MGWYGGKSKGWKKNKNVKLIFNLYLGVNSFVDIIKGLEKYKIKLCDLQFLIIVLFECRMYFT